MTKTMKTRLAGAAASIALMATPALAQTAPIPEQAPACAAGPVTADMLCAPEAVHADTPAASIDPARDPAIADPAMTSTEVVGPTTADASEGWDGADLTEAPTAIQNAVNDGDYTAEDLNRAMLAALQAEPSST
jgi:hypothetical protein